MEQHNINTQTAKVPHVRAIGLSMQAIAALIRQRLGWSEDRYSEFQMEAGYEFLNVVLKPLKGDQSNDMKLLTYSNLFWGWWRNEWFKRDKDIYKWSNLSPEDYEYLHTNDMTGDVDTQLRFWSHVDEFLKAGEAKLREVTA